MSTLLLASALAGYLDPIEGRPTWDQRALHTWTNLTRVDPMAWASEYSCSTSSFSSSERSSKAPLHYHDGLTEIAQLHSEDMRSSNRMTHDSSDGTSFSSRVWPYYQGSTIAENVAYGYGDTWKAQFQGWMCSSGHRANIMSGSMQHLGAGVDGTWYTQDFGGGGNTDTPPVAMGVHSPQVPVAKVTYWTTWGGLDAPADLAVDSDEGCVTLELEAGTQERGAWVGEDDAGEGCVRYRFVWETASGETGAIPASGSWQYGQGCEAFVYEVAGSCGYGGDGGGGDTGGLGLDTGAAIIIEDGCERTATDRNGDCLEDEPLEQPGGCASAPVAGIWVVSLLAVGRRRRG